MILEIDVHGGQAVIEQYPEAVTIFVRPSSLAELERRLRGRGTESEEAIAGRLERAKYELSFADRYRHVVLNDDLEQAVREICSILSRVLGGQAG